jgi:hypothetical protein
MDDETSSFTALSALALQQFVLIFVFMISVPVNCRGVKTGLISTVLHPNSSKALALTALAVISELYSESYLPHYI